MGGRVHYSLLLLVRMFHLLNRLKSFNGICDEDVHETLSNEFHLSFSDPYFT